MSNLDVIKNRIRALSAKTVENGCTEAEALAAIAKVGEMLSAYNLTMTEVELRAEKCEKSTIETGSKHSPAISWAIGAIATFTDTKVWCERGASVRYVFFGQPSDVEMAGYLYRIIGAAIESELVKFKRTPTYQWAHSKRGASADFAKAMALRVGRRLSEMHRANAAAETSVRSGNALIVLKNQLVNDQYAELNPRLRSASKSTLNASSAAAAGYAAGANVNLSRPVNGSGAVLRLTA